LSELDIGLPELLIAPIGDVRAQKIGALRERGPVVERGVASHGEAKACRTIVRLQRNCKAGGGPLVLLQDTADLPVHLCRIEALLRPGDAGAKAFERLFDPPAELVMHRPFFAAPIVNRRRTLAQERRAILARLACDGMRV
jgi:hypothetical protein